MDTVTVVWSAMAGACAMLAAMHFLVWLRNRQAWGNFFFPVTVIGVLGLATCELISMRTDSPEVFVACIRHAHLVHIFISAGILGFVHCQFGTGRLWLLWVALGARVLAIVVNFLSGQSLHVAEAKSLKVMRFLGEDVSALGEWVPNRWMMVGQLASLLMLVYLLDATWRLWRRGGKEERRRALWVGGSVMFFVVEVPVQSWLVVTGRVEMPFLVSIPFLGVVTVMGVKLSNQLFRTLALTRELDVTQSRLALAAQAARLTVWEWEVGSDRLWISEHGGQDGGYETTYPHWLSSLLPEDRPKLEQAMAAALSGTEPLAADYRVALENGDVRWIAAGGRVERGARGEAVMLRGVSLDVTERRRAEMEAASRQRELAHLSRIHILGELAGALAHELNQPLAAILGNSQVGSKMLKVDSPDLVEVSAILQDVADDAKRAGGIIHGMRAMFRKESAAEPQAVDVNDAVRQIEVLLHAELVRRRVTVVLDLADPLPDVAAGKVEVQQVLMNLVMNALDAMKSTGGGRLWISTARQGGEVVTTVRDSGPGIPEEMMSRLFEPFVSSKQSGLGLGLAICRGIAERYQGRLEGGNHADGGAEFRFALAVAGR